jgi:hypothetical protein
MADRRNVGLLVHGIVSPMIGAALSVAFGVLALGGCSSTAPAPPSAAMKRTELHFSLDQCQQLENHLYKCPAIDKPVCSPDFNGTAVDCVRIGPNGGIYVLGPNGD